MANVKLVKVNKIYDNNVQAVFDFSIDIKDNEFIVFVGPSGCGKSTTLRMIAGLEEITSGDLFIDGELVNTVAPKDRGIAMVFQSYALYPQMTVFNNMAYALKLRKANLPVIDKKTKQPVLDENGEVKTTLRHYSKQEIKEKVEAAAKILGLTEYLDRKPRALSGGQRQRVALGRAIVRSPKVFLMDEPLSNLDAKLRVQMRSEIVRIHEEVKSTTIYVTHDQVEAMTMADRIVVMKDGYIQQIDTPEEVYTHPANTFVAGFIGTPAMNLLDAHLGADGKTLSFVDGSSVTLTKEQMVLLKNYKDKDVIYGIRPEHIIYNEKHEYGRFTQKMKLQVRIVELLGDILNCYCVLPGAKDVIVKTTSQERIKAKDILEVAINTDFTSFFNASTGKVITLEHNEYEELPPKSQEEAKPAKKKWLFKK